MWVINNTLDAVAFGKLKDELRWVCASSDFVAKRNFCLETGVHGVLF